MGRAVSLTNGNYIFPHPILGQPGGQTFSVFTAFLFLCFFDLPLSDANVVSVKAPASANKNILFIFFILNKMKCLQEFE